MPSPAFELDPIRTPSGFHDWGSQAARLKRRERNRTKEPNV